MKTEPSASHAPSCRKPSGTNERPVAQARPDIALRRPRHFAAFCGGWPAQLWLMLSPAQTAPAFAADGFLLLEQRARGAPHLPRTDAPIPWDEIGARASAQPSGDGLKVTRTRDGARLWCIFQRLEARATPAGLWITSTADGAQGDTFRVVAVAVGRATVPLKPARPPRCGVVRPSPGAAAGLTPGARSREVGAAPENTVVLARTGTVAMANRQVRFIRSGLTEEYSVSADGVRQDFVVLEKPVLSSNSQPSAHDPDPLRIELAVSGAKVEAMADGACPVSNRGQAVRPERGDLLSHGVRLVLEKSGRKIAYCRLRVNDATGKALPARMELQDSSAFSFALEVDDAQAVYPVRVDPTFSDANWISMGAVPGTDGPVGAAVVDGSGNLYIGGLISTAGGKASSYVARLVLGEAPGYNQLTGVFSAEGTMQISFIGDPATNYALDRAGNLTPTMSWVGQQTNTMTVSGVLLFTNTPVADTNNYWRVRSVP